MKRGQGQECLARRARSSCTPVRPRLPEIAVMAGHLSTRKGGVRPDARAARAGQQWRHLVHDQAGKGLPCLQVRDHAGCCTGRTSRARVHPCHPARLRQQRVAPPHPVRLHRCRGVRVHEGGRVQVRPLGSSLQDRPSLVRLDTGCGSGVGGRPARAEGRSASTQWNDRKGEKFNASIREASRSKNIAGFGPERFKSTAGSALKSFIPWSPFTNAREGERRKVRASARHAPRVSGRCLPGARHLRHAVQWLQSPGRRASPRKLQGRAVRKVRSAASEVRLSWPLSRLRPDRSIARRPLAGNFLKENHHG